MNKIESVENDFTMKSGDVVPIRTRNLNEIKKEYYNYIEYRGNIAGTTKRLKVFYDKVGGDFEVVKRRLIDEKYVVRFVQCFKNDTAFNELKKALNEELYEKAYLCAHTLKGSSVSLDFGKLYKASSALTETLYNINHNGEDCDKILIDKQFGEVAKEYKNVINSMQIIEEDWHCIKISFNELNIVLRDYILFLYKKISEPKFGYYNLWYAIRGSNPRHPD